jgi:hypothetical protein
MKVYAVEHDLNRLLLVQGSFVINGAYELDFYEDGSVGCFRNNMRAYLVMDVPEDWLKSVKFGRCESNYYHDSYLELWEKIDKAVLSL